MPAIFLMIAQILSAIRTMTRIFARRHTIAIDCRHTMIFMVAVAGSSLATPVSLHLKTLMVKRMGTRPPSAASIWPAVP